MPRRRMLILAMALGLPIASGPPSACAQATASAAAPAAQTSGLPIPRFVSLKSDRVHVRQGPGTDYKVVWVFQRAGLPVEVIKEFEGWRQIRDADGTTGWVTQWLLSGRRTALVLPWEVKGEGGERATAELRDDDRPGARAVAAVEAGVLANIVGCDGKWCRVVIGVHRGYIEQPKLWGVYAGEAVK